MIMLILTNTPNLMLLDLVLKYYDLNLHLLVILIGIRNKCKCKLWTFKLF